MTDSDGSYPPDHHVLRDLAFTAERRDGRTVVTAEVTPMLTHGTNHIGVGVLAILLDVSGASMAIDAVQPDWIATVDLTYHGRPVPIGPLVVDVAPVRVGKNLVVMGAAVGAGAVGDDTKGHGLVTFSRIPGSATEATVERGDGERAAPLAPAQPLDEPIEDRLGIEIVDPAIGHIEMAHHDYARNSFGTINGGVVGLLCETAGRHWAEARHDRPMVSHGLEVHYLAQATTGPACTRVTPIRTDHHSTTVRVEVIDAGHDNTLLAIGLVSLASPT